MFWLGRQDSNLQGLFDTWLTAKHATITLYIPTLLPTVFNHHELADSQVHVFTNALLGDRNDSPDNGLLGTIQKHKACFCLCIQSTKSLLPSHFGPEVAVAFMTTTHYNLGLLSILSDPDQGQLRRVDYLGLLESVLGIHCSSKPKAPTIVGALANLLLPDYKRTSATAQLLSAIANVLAVSILTYLV
jgi:hypothetical protein